MKLRPAKKTNARRSRGKGTSLLNILTGKWGKSHRLPAHVTGEGDWEVEVPQIRMSRAFAVMLVLHIIAVGGLFAFRIWGRDDEKKEDVQIAENTAPASEAPAAAFTEPAAPSTAPAPTDVTPAPAEGTPVPVADVTPVPAADTAAQRTYAWKTGDTLPLVAARFGISGQALREANPGKLLAPGTVLVVPKAGRVIDSMDVASSGGKPSDFFDPAAPAVTTLTSADVIPPKAEVVPELDLDTGVPEVPADSADRPGEARPENVAVVRPEAAAPPAVMTKPPVRPAPKTPEAVVVKPKPKTPEAAPAPSRTAGQRAHVVSKGDTVYNIARRYGVSAGEIAKLNGLDGDYRIRMGQQLRIPVRR